MKSLLKKLKIDETHTKQIRQKQKEYNKIKYNIPMKEDYNFMADLIMMPETKAKYKYLLSVVDLATDEFDIEPLKTKTPEEVLEAFKRIIRRPHLKMPYASIKTDGGTEFKGVFHKWFLDEGTLHKVGLAGRHKQVANVEALNKQVERLFNGYMNEKEKLTGKTYKEWTDILSFVRKELNKIRKKDLSKIEVKQDYKFVFEEKPKYKIGDIVYEKLDTPENALGHKQPTEKFRVGDFRFSAIPKKIINVLIFSDKPHYRYILEGIPNASYSENELIPSKEKETKYKIKKILDKKKIKGKTHYLIWWDKYKKVESTWEAETQLIKDGVKSMIDEFNKK